MAKFLKTVLDKEINTQYDHYVIDDYSYFSMIDNQVRSEYTLCEEYTLLPMIEKIYSEAGVSSNLNTLTHYPVEGYYYKTEGLTKYFQLIRNLQENAQVYSKINSELSEVKDLVWLLGNTIWGTVKSERSETPFPRMKDILTNTMNALQLKHLWTIPNIMKCLDKFATGNPNLVELAYLTKDIRCLTAGAETNSLYREFAVCCSGCGSFGFLPPKIVKVYHWDINEKVQSLGEKLIDKYNEILNKFQKTLSPFNDTSPSLTAKKTLTFGNKNWGRSIPKLLVKPTMDNQESLDQFLESPRVAMLGLCKDDGQYYHWILDYDAVKEVWSDGMITTENYINKTGPEIFNIKNWDWSGVEKDGVTDLKKLWNTKNDNGYKMPEIIPGLVTATVVVGENGIVTSWSDPKYAMSQHD